jgi:hypothetical protein
MPSDVAVPRAQIGLHVRHRSLLSTLANPVQKSEPLHVFMWTAYDKTSESEVLWIKAKHRNMFANDASITMYGTVRLPVSSNCIQTA